MKKFISALAASVMAVSALAVMPTSAADIPEVNVLDVSNQTANEILNFYVAQQTNTSYTGNSYLGLWGTC